MSIVKHGIQIRDLDDWRDRAGPKDPVLQWKDHRSAKELARAWLEPGDGHLPVEVADLLTTHSDFSRVQHWQAVPEVQLRFDEFAGEPRNTDLLVIGEDAQGPFLLAVEGKADETFGPTVGEALLEGLEVRVAKPASRRIERIVQLVEAILPVTPGPGVPRVESLRYQLLTAVAGAACEAERRQIGRVVLLVHEFVTDCTVDVRHAMNADDLNHFTARLTSGVVNVIQPGQLVGPIHLPGAPLFDPRLHIYMAKATRTIRGRCA